MKVYLFIIALAFASLSAFAQSASSEIDSLTSVRDAIKQEITKLTEQKTSLDSTKTSLAKDIKHFYNDKWCNAIIENTQEEIRKLDAEIESKKSIIANNSETIKEYIYAITIQIEEQKEKQSESAAYNSSFIKQNIATYMAYTQKPFSEIDVDILNTYKDKVVASLTPQEATPVIDALDNARILKEKVVEADGLLSMPFDDQAKEDMLNWFDNNEKHFNSAQWDEIDSTTYTYLTRYENGTLKFRDYLVAIKAAWDDSGENEIDVKPRIREIIASQTNQDPKLNNEERYYKNIPYLWSRYCYIKKILQRSGVKKLVSDPKFIEYYDEFSKIKN